MDIKRKFDDEINQMIITSYIADMAKYTENIESIRNSKIYNSIPAQLGKENKKFKYSLVEKSARASGSDEALRLVPPIQMSLEQAIEFIQDDELVEVTPKSIRLRKKILDTKERERAARRK